MNETQFTIIRIKKETRKRLKEIGKKGETWDDIIQKIITKQESD